MITLTEERLKIRLQVYKILISSCDHKEVVRTCLNCLELFVSRNNSTECIKCASIKKGE
jgi:hypothetical protein